MCIKLTLDAKFRGINDLTCKTTLAFFSNKSKKKKKKTLSYNHIQAKERRALVEVQAKHHLSEPRCQACARLLPMETWPKLNNYSISLSCPGRWKFKYMPDELSICCLSVMVVSPQSFCAGTTLGHGSFAWAMGRKWCSPSQILSLLTRTHAFRTDSIVRNIQRKSLYEAFHSSTNSTLLLSNKIPWAQSDQHS